MSIATSTRDLREVFREAATAGGYAPSIHNTQPWHWRVRRDCLELWSVPDRQLTGTDPDGRMLTLSCGAALHHARVALDALGYPAAVTLLPDLDGSAAGEPAPAGDPDAEPGAGEPGERTLLARLTVGEHRHPDDAAMRHYQAIAIRHTDRRPVTAEPADAGALATIGTAVTAAGTRPPAGPGAHLHLLHPEQVLELAAAASYAQATENTDPVLRAELDYWVGGDRPGRLGVPDANLPADPPATTVPVRDFGHQGRLPVTAGHDRAASYGLLYTDRDDQVGWLTAGQALAAGWLAATELGVSVLPLSAVIEVPATRLRRPGMLVADSYPQIVLRFGTADPDHRGPEPTPRLPESATVTVDPD